VDEVILTTCPRDCYDACGVAVVKRDGRIRHVRGDPSHPVSRGRLCVKCSTAYKRVLLDPGARLLAPGSPDRAEGRRELRAGLVG
jgi:anaerobic selenocysteine-containing dehydrogenase